MSGADALRLAKATAGDPAREAGEAPPGTACSGPSVSSRRDIWFRSLPDAKGDGGAARLPGPSTRRVCGRRPWMRGIPDQTPCFGRGGLEIARSPQSQRPVGGVVGHLCRAAGCAPCTAQGVAKHPEQPERRHLCAGPGLWQTQASSGSTGVPGEHAVSRRVAGVSEAHSMTVTTCSLTLCETNPEAGSEVARPETEGSGGRGASLNRPGEGLRRWGLVAGI